MSAWCFWAEGHLAAHLIVSFLGIHCYVTWNIGGDAYPLGGVSILVLDRVFGVLGYS